MALLLFTFYSYILLWNAITSFGLVDPKLNIYQRNEIYNNNDDVEDRTGSFPFLMPFVSPKTVRTINIWFENKCVCTRVNTCICMYV